MSFAADIDIDTDPSFDPTQFFPWTRASLVKNDELAQHNCGVHPQRIAVDPLTGCAAIPYKEAEELGYAKIDFLHLNVYENFKTRKEIEELLEIEPDWGLLTIPSEQIKLFQLSKHGDILSAVKPRSIEELADVLALIRPGKRPYVNLYKTQKEATRRILYSKDDKGFSFKKSHAIAYALVIQLQLHLISAGIL